MPKIYVDSSKGLQPLPEIESGFLVGTHGNKVTFVGIGKASFDTQINNAVNAMYYLMQSFNEQTNHKTTSEIVTRTVNAFTSMLEVFKEELGQTQPNNTLGKTDENRQIQA